jgi:CRISPR/Cas system CMR subunit Cmr4 (Cas7 group RAMP superfamily)
MKINTQKTIKIYYLILAAVLAAQAALTVFKLGQTVSYQDRISKLQNQKRELLIEQQTVETKLGQVTSLSLNYNNFSDEFEPIEKPIHLSSDQVVALR